MGKFLKNELKVWSKMTGVSNQWALLKSTTLEATRLYVRQVRINGRKKTIWFTKEVSRIVKGKKIAYRRFKETGVVADREEYKNRQNEARHYQCCQSTERGGHFLNLRK